MFVSTVTDQSRKFVYGCVETYRYSHNGHEKEDVIYNGAQSAEFWMYDSRVGRRWERDPLPFYGSSPYSAFLNNPINFSDPDGDLVEFARFRDRVNIFFTALFSKKFREIHKTRREDKNTTYTYDRRKGSPILEDAIPMPDDIGIDHATQYFTVQYDRNHINFNWSFNNNSVSAPGPVNDWVRSVENPEQSKGETFTTEYKVIEKDKIELRFSSAEQPNKLEVWINGSPAKIPGLQNEQYQTQGVEVFDLSPYLNAGDVFTIKVTNNLSATGENWLYNVTITTKGEVGDRSHKVKTKEGPVPGGKKAQVNKVKWKRRRS